MTKDEKATFKALQKRLEKITNEAEQRASKDQRITKQMALEMRTLTDDYKAATT